MNPKSFMAALVLSLGMVLAGCSSNQKKQMKANDYLDDKVTARRVENTLHRQHGYTFPEVHVACSNAVVYLEGSVPNEQQRERAEQLARQVHRAKDIQNRIVVQP